MNLLIDCLTKAIILYFRQQQDLQHERELRKLQAEDIRHLHEKVTIVNMFYFTINY